MPTEPNDVDDSQTRCECAFLHKHRTRVFDDTTSRMLMVVCGQPRIGRALYLCLSLYRSGLCMSAECGDFGVGENSHPLTFTFRRVRAKFSHQSINNFCERTSETAAAAAAATNEQAALHKSHKCKSTYTSHVLHTNTHTHTNSENYRNLYL